MSGTNSESSNPTDPISVGNLPPDTELEVLCDAGAANAPFLRRYDTSSTGVVTKTDTLLDGTTAYVVVGPVIRCTAISGSVSVSNFGADDELDVLCDSGAANKPFLRQYAYPPGGGAPVVSNFELDGVTPYVVVGPVARCTSVTVTNFPAIQPVSGTVAVSNQFDDEYQVLCDTTPTTFIRRFRTDSAGAVTIANFTLAGGAFVPVGAVGQCGVIISDGSGPITVDGTVSVSNNRDDEWEVLCDAGAAGAQFLRRYRTDSAGVVTSANFLLDGTTAYVVLGVATRCTNISGVVPLPTGAATLAAQRDDEYEVLCDAGAAGLQFLRRYRTDSAGVVTIVNTTLDGTTAYVVLGAATACRGISGTVPLPTGAATLAAQRDDEYQILCDSTPTTFLRRYRTDSAGVVTITNTTLDGTTAFAPIGAVGTCPTANPTNRRDTFDEILCDAGAANLPFLRRYTVDNAGVVTITDTTLNGTTAYVLVGAAARCNAITAATLPLPAGAATLAAQRDDEYQILCDSTPTTFLRRYRTDSAGVVTITNTTLDGTTAFAPIGAVGPCSDFSTNDFEVLCDNNGSFLRRYQVSGAGVLTIVNLTLAGGAYVPVGTVTQCGKNTGSITVTLLSGVASLVSSVLARRITFVYGNNDTVAANRPSINGVATLESPNGLSEQINTLVIGSLDSPNTLPAITYATNEAGDSANVIQEF